MIVQRSQFSQVGIICLLGEDINSKLFILRLYEDQKLIGLAPLQITNSLPKSLIQGRTIGFIGCGEEIQDKIVSQYTDLIINSRNKQKMIA